MGSDVDNSSARSKPSIFVDADACPVKDEIIGVADRHDLDAYLVSNRGFRTHGRAKTHNILVDDKFDAADDWIADNIGPGDIAVTADIPLASRCLELGGRALGPTGKPFTEHGIGMALAMRDLMSDLRAMGEVSGGGPAFSKRDRETFLTELEKMVILSLSEQKKPGE